MYINGVYINPLHAIAVFIAVLFIYIQIQYYYKVAPDENVNIYELTQELAKKQFDRVCDSDRIPFVFEFFETPAILRFMAATDFTTCGAVPIHIRQGAAAHANFKTVPFIRGMELMSGALLAGGQLPPNTVTERNSELLKALHISAFLKRRDAYLRPALCQYVDYDLLMGAPGSATPLRYEINQRTFFMVTEGVAYIRLLHPAVAAAEFRPNEEPDCDNRLMEYRSVANLWSSRTSRRIPCIHLTIKTGQTLYIPPFWWYTIQFVQGTGTRLLRFSYRSIINSLVLAPYFISHKMYAFSDGGSDATDRSIPKTVMDTATPKSILKKKSRKRSSAVTFADNPQPDGGGTTGASPPNPTPTPTPTPGTTSIISASDEPPTIPIADPNADATPLDAAPGPAPVADTTTTTPLLDTPDAPPTMPHPSGFVIPQHTPLPDPLRPSAIETTEPPKNPKAPNLERLLAQMNAID